MRPPSSERALSRVLLSEHRFDTLADFLMVQQPARLDIRQPFPNLRTKPIIVRHVAFDQFANHFIRCASALSRQLIEFGFNIL